MGTPATLSCKVTGLTAGVDITWLPSNSGTVTTGSLDTSSGTQTSTLLIENPQTDQTYTCKVTSTVSAGSAESETTTDLDCFSKILQIEISMQKYVSKSVSRVSSGKLTTSGNRTPVFRTGDVIVATTPPNE